LMYFCNKPYTPSAENIEQITKVLQFKQEISEKGLYSEYTEVSDLKDLVRVHLHKAILSLRGEEADMKAVQPLDASYRTYLDKLRRRCRLLPLGAFGFEQGAEDEVTLDQVYINLLTTTHQKKEEGDDAEQVPVSALEAVEHAERLVILGDPGSGKSTFVNQLLANFADARLDGLPLPAGLLPDLVPVRMVLRRFANKLAAVELKGLSSEERQNRLAALFMEQIMQDVEEELSTPGASDALGNAFDTGQVLLVLDGLDEIPSALRGLMPQAVQALLNRYSVARTIITCRVRSYQEQEKQIPGFETCTLAPFENEQKQLFVSAWYNTPHSLAHFGEEKAKKKAENLRAAVVGPALNDLARNPMLLTTMAVIHQRDIGLPDQRARLYELAVDVLLRRWLAHRGSDVKMSDDLKSFLAEERQLLSTMYKLAYEAHATGSGKKTETDISRGDALILLEKKAHLGSAALAGEFLDYVDQRSGILVGQGGGDEAPLTYSFPHRTFQEYLAGCHIVSQPDLADALIEHAAQDDYWYVPVQMGLEELLHNRKQDWQLLRLAYQLAPAGFKADNASRQRLVLWAGVMAKLVKKEFILNDTKTPGGGAGFFEHLKNHLVVLLSGLLPPIERVEAGRILGHIGDPRVGIGALAEMPFCYVPAGAFLRGDDAEETGVSHDYWIGQYPVTQAQYAVFAESGGYADKKWWTGAGWERKEEDPWKNRRSIGDPFDLPNHPVVGVSWYEALAFTRWLTAKGHEEGWLAEGALITLPGENEWEKAARGGLNVPGEHCIRPLKELDRTELSEFSNNEASTRRFPWGEDIDGEYCNYNVDIGTTTTPGVYSKGKSPYGLQDASGNVWEWSRAKWKGGEDEEGTDTRVVRGGSWDYNNLDVRCAYRDSSLPVYRYYLVGFRIVLLP
ncbi:MAG: SUMF1/EgtB/PvdO family nonheme iron enzyme, partial [Rhodothermales bacterium]